MTTGRKTLGFRLMSTSKSNILPKTHPSLEKVAWLRPFVTHDASEIHDSPIEERHSWRSIELPIAFCARVSCFLCSCVHMHTVYSCVSCVSVGGCVGGWLRVAAGGCGWLRVAADGCGWLRVAAGGCGWLRVAAGGWVGGW